jgi:hypothetical protein
MRYFNNIQTHAAGEQRYRELAKKLHPDTGGKASEFQAMKAEWDELKIFFKHQDRFTSSSKKHTEARPKPNPPKSPKTPTQKKTRQTEKPLPRPIPPTHTPPQANIHDVLKDAAKLVESFEKAAPDFLSILEGAERFFKQFESE